MALLFSAGCGGGSSATPGVTATKGVSTSTAAAPTSIPSGGPTVQVRVTAVPSANAPKPAPTASAIPTIGGGSPALGATEAAKKDLANRLGVAEDQIKVVSVEEVDWPDASLGCPEPGKMYAQMITPGYRITLEAGGKTYEYHSGAGDRVVSCPK